MKSNQLPPTSGQLILLGEKMQEGVTALRTKIPITLVTATQVGTDTSAFATADSAFGAGRSAQQEASDAYQVTTGPLYDWLLSVSNMLASRFGTRWNTAWAQAGFVNHSTGIPAKLADRMGLALSLVKFFTANPAFELPSMDLTAAQGKVLRAAVLAAQSALTNAGISLKKLGESRELAYDRLVQTMRELINNLDAKLKRDDTRWLAFGLRIPATSATPGKPVNLSAHADDTAAIIVQCDAVPLATRYRWRMLFVGLDTKYSLAASTTEPMAAITGVEPGRTVQFIVQAVNGNLQGVASDPIQFTVLIPAAKVREAQPVVESAEAGGGNGNGKGHRHSHANGNGTPSRVA